MAGSVNRVILVGNLGRDPKVRHTQDAKPIVNLPLATSETWRDRKTGEHGMEKYSTEVVRRNCRGEPAKLGGSPGSGEGPSFGGGQAKTQPKQKENPVACCRFRGHALKLTPPSSRTQWG
ncbi:MAG: single-stranded DNA-binding protein [Aestuariivirga sp.]|uniref:single-stranded DNA-binding protein n=1 Tax=Aestuariivirga sp. TaxID=2650926 RepID=UPI0038D0627B